MPNLSAEDIARYGILLSGGELPTVAFEPEVPSYFGDEDRAAQAFVDAWVSSQILREVRRGPLLCVTGIDLGTRVIMVTTRFDYGHFVALRNERDRAACYDAYMGRADAGLETSLTREVFLRMFNPRPLANAVWVITDDDKGLLVRRSPTMDLHPDYIHCNGGKVAAQPGQTIDLQADALERLKIETGIPLADIDDVSYLGVCRNDPFDEVIILFGVRTALPRSQVIRVYGKAREPDGGIEWCKFDIRAIQRLLRRRDLTPSFQALLCLFLQQLTEEAPPSK